MPRPPKPRRCWGPPPHEVFKPVGIPMGRLQVVQLALDELEALRLCDLLGLDQETAGMRMGVSRGTVQRLLSAARAKVADALVNGKALVIVRTPYVQFHWGAGPGPHRHRGPPP